MAGKNDGLFAWVNVPSAGQAAQLVLLSAPVTVGEAHTAAGCRRGDQGAFGIEPGLLWLSAHPRTAQARRANVRSQDGVAGHAPAWLAIDVSETEDESRTAARGQGGGGGAEPALVLRHHGHPGVGWTEGTLSSDDRLCGPDGAFLAFRQAYHGRGSGRDSQGGHLPAIWGGAALCSRDRVAQRQRAGIYFRPVRAVRASDGACPVPHAAPQSTVEGTGRGVLRKLQAGLCLPSMFGELGGSEAPAARVDRTLQSQGAAQRVRNASTSRVLCGVDSQKQETTCPKLSGSVQA